MHATPRHQQTGLTLVETMATLTVAAILLTAAVPPMQDFITRNRMSTEVNTFVASLYLTRSEAVKRLQDVKICAAKSDYSACSGSSDWEKGWMVFVDVNGNGKVDPEDAVLQMNAALPGRFRIDGGGHSQAAYRPTGQAGGYNGTFEFCDTGNVANSRNVILSKEGRVRVEQLAITGCTVADGDDGDGKGKGKSKGKG